MKKLNKLTTSNKIRTSILKTALLTVLCGSNLAVAASSSAWSCGAWVTDATNTCIETKKCTRTLCDAKGKLDNCRIETKISTATKANCTPPNAKPSASVFKKGFTSQGVMMKAPSIKPIKIKPTIGSSVNKIPNAVTKHTDIKKGTIGQPERRSISNSLPTTKSTVKTLHPASKKKVSLPNINRVNIAKPNYRSTRSIQAPASKRVPTISSLKPKAHLNKSPVIFSNNVQGTKVKSDSVINKHSVLGGSGFVPTQSVNVLGSSKAGHLGAAQKSIETGPIIKKINIPFAFFADELQSAFQATKIHLNNYGSRHGNSWYKGNDSFVELPAALGQAKQKFSFPVKNAIPFRYYMNDVNLSSIQVNPSQDRLAIEFNFESNGTEIKGRCATGGVKKVLCAIGSDSAAPDVQMNNAKASVYLTPAVRNGSISFSQVTSDFTADIQAQGACNVIGLSYVCNALTGYKSEIKNAAKQAIENAVNSDAIRNKIAEKMRLKLVSYGVRDVVSVEVLSNILVIKHRVKQGQMAFK